MKDKKKKYIVFGAARSGLAAARLLKHKGYDVLLIDQKPPQKFRESIREMEEAGIECRGGVVADESLLENAAGLVVSPGVPLDNPVLKLARKMNIEISGELELGSRYSEADIVAITGTNGKTTTVNLCRDILEQGGVGSAVAGNVGFPLCSAIMDKTVNAPGNCFSVEVSSYQLETIHKFHPRVSAILNISPDHLDRHKTMEAYARAKFRITENQGEDDYLILNADNEACLQVRDQTRAKVLYFSVNKTVSPGAYLQDDSLWLDIGEKIFLLRKDEIPVPGMHNVENVLASALAGFAMNVSPESICRAVRLFPGVEHRIEYVTRINGVSFYNDSKATNLDSLEKALQSFTRPVRLIAGGRDKGDDYNRLNDLVKNKVKSLVVMGEAAPLILKAWQKIVPAFEAENFDEAVKKSFASSEKGDVVLLSPACSSFDRFRDFEERGLVFKAAVKKFEKSMKMQMEAEQR